VKPNQPPSGQVPRPTRRRPMSTTTPTTVCEARNGVSTQSAPLPLTCAPVGHVRVLPTYALCPREFR
jgi:hypothetical protein